MIWYAVCVERVAVYRAAKTDAQMEVNIYGVALSLLSNVIKLIILNLENLIKILTFAFETFYPLYERYFEAL